MIGGQEVEGRKTVAVGLSGGVDSAVAAWMLKQQGHEVIGVFMRNWDESEERGESACSAEADWNAAQTVANHLSIPIHEADFVRQYWTQVFSEFVSQCSQGLTPNPDLACNRHIKFGALLDFCRGLGADCVATGHYARLARCGDTGRPLLLRGRDASKDQSYFLASVEGSTFSDVMFPLGDMHKAEVRRVAEAAGLPSAARRSSAGICFIGRREFGDFIAEYSGAIPGTFVDVENGEALGSCANLAVVTHGQGAGISGLPERVYVVGKDMRERIAYVARGRDHPALFCTTSALQAPHWIAGEPPAALSEGVPLRCQYKARYRQVLRDCTVQDVSGLSPAEAATCDALQRGAHCRLADSAGASESPGLLVRFEQPARAITPQQAFVMYQGDICLGSAPVLHPGQSLFERNIPLDPSVSGAADTIDEAYAA
ncbi:tRNA-specific 2-thiouridylase MnmA [Coccomyxa sp. Obi]|nr:tRNA-specific 2-thiouridylase MnmA [Coccomyxa sp. Obi]